MRSLLTPLFALGSVITAVAQTSPFLHADLQFATHVCTDTTYTTDSF